MSPLIAHTQKMRTEYPQAKLVLWASLECTNFSKAKGGQPRDADSRTLAEHLFRYIEALNPDYIQIENVEEFMSWGPMDKDGHPLSMQKGKDYEKWIRNVKKYGYNFDHRILNAADYEAYTSRKRFFGIFAKKGLPIVFPEATRSKEGSNSLFGNLKKWNAVKDVLDFEDEGTSIFTRKKPISEKTLGRVFAGLIKFVAGGKAAFIVKYNSINKKTGKHVPPSIDEPCPTVTTKDRFAMITSFFMNQYSGGGQVSDINAPCPAVTTTPKQNLITCKPWIMSTNFNNIGSDINRPSQTITANRKWHYLMNPQFTSPGSSIEKPCFTLIAKMDKRPPYLITSQQGQTHIAIYETDSPMTIKIKEFMALYGIIDIKMRMLRIPELKRIMGFPTNYVLVGSQADQKKFIGNAVEVNMARVLCESLSRELKIMNIIAA